MNSSILTRGRQQGVALIVVLLIIALISVIATNINGRNQLMMRRTLNLAEYDQAYWYAISAEELAKKVIKQDLDDSDGRAHLQQYWAQTDVIFPAEKGNIGGSISDMRTCFNLNALSQTSVKDNHGQSKLPLAAKQYKGLLVALGVDEFLAERLTHTLKDYIDEDTITSPFGAEDADYESRHVPYRAANTLMSHHSELRAVLGYTQAIYLTLQPYICAIPGNNKQLLNINTLPAEKAALLAGMFENKLSLGEAENVLNQRPIDGFSELAEFKQLSSVADLFTDGQLSSSFTIKTEYFKLDAFASVETAIFRLASILRVGRDNKSKVISRQFGDQT